MAGKRVPSTQVFRTADGKLRVIVPTGNPRYAWKSYIVQQVAGRWVATFPGVLKETVHESLDAPVERIPASQFIAEPGGQEAMRKIRQDLARR